ncbi:hypothetical protein [Paraburkholderia sp. 35.1]|uniref:hypothetical protein n=1 Tax=Paraburkholderia sp. 35.1 TaxID=2991058 RepID=UPI003D1E4306
MAKTTEMVTFHVPTDNQEMLAAIGEVALRHEQLTYALRMTIKTLTGVSVGDALDATTNTSTYELRRLIRKLASQRLGDGAPLLKLHALLQRCERATSKRNELIHSVWAQRANNETVRSGSGGDWHPTPTASDLHKLAATLSDLTSELIEARSTGYLHKALADKSKKSKTD